MQTSRADFISPTELSIRQDAASAEAAYRKNVDSLNDWRNQPVERHDAAAPIPAPTPVPSTGNPALDAEAAYRQSVNNLNAWRNER